LTRTTEYYTAPGKLLITGEYLVLEGAEGLALPLKQGQDLTVIKTESQNRQLVWEAFSPEGLWFSATFALPSFTVINSSDKAFAQRLTGILQAAQHLNQGFPASGSYKVKTVLDFNPEFGFGSSSTLIANVARWAKVDAFELQNLTFNGSGYDVAVALEAKPIIYSLKQKKPVYRPVVFNPAFAGNLYFVYLGKKQRSLEEVKRFKERALFSPADVDAITTITREIVNCHSLQPFESLLKEHETILSSILKTTPVHKQLFPDYTKGIVKSLGAWGGDFVLITSTKPADEFKKEMKKYGFEIVYGFNDIVHN
jgi:mevalonate kinase